MRTTYQPIINMTVGEIARRRWQENALGQVSDKKSFTHAHDPDDESILIFYSQRVWRLLAPSEAAARMSNFLFGIIICSHYAKLNPRPASHER